jgi:hypothetical protein
MRVGVVLLLLALAAVGVAAAAGNGGGGSALYQRLRASSTDSPSRSLSAVDWAHQTAASLAALAASEFTSLTRAELASIPTPACTGFQQAQLLATGSNPGSQSCMFFLTRTALRDGAAGARDQPQRGDAVLCVAHHPFSFLRAMLCVSDVRRCVLWIHSRLLCQHWTGCDDGTVQSVRDVSWHSHVAISVRRRGQRGDHFRCYVVSHGVVSFFCVIILLFVIF